MIDPLTMVTGGAGLGAVLGLISNFFAGRNETQLELKKQEGINNAALAGNLAEYQQNFRVNEKGVAVHPPFYFPILLITATYCVCTGICFAAGDIPIATQQFNGEPNEMSIMFGLITRSSSDKTVYILTLAGLGTYFMAPLAFILTSVLTGIVPKRTRM